MLKSLIALAAIALPAFAATGPSTSTPFPFPKLSGCTVKPNTLVMPSDAQKTLGTPPPVPKFVGLALGTQNYTCNTTDNTWTLYGVDSYLYDVTCLVGNPDVLASTQDAAWLAWNTSSIKTVQELIDTSRARPAETKYPIALGRHDFVVNPVTGVGNNPRFDFSEYTGKKNDQFVGVHIETWSDGKPEDVLWLHVVHVAGDLFNQLWRTRTNGGNPPTPGCKAGQTKYVKYSATYWMFPN